MSDETDAGAGADAAAGDETRRLLDALQDWARRVLPEPPSGHAGPECQWCPLCQVASVLRGEHPELTERMTEAGTAIAQAVRAVAESAAAHAPGAGDTARAGAAGTRPRPRPRPGRRVQRIALTETEPEPPVTPPDPDAGG